MLVLSVATLSVMAPLVAGYTIMHSGAREEIWRLGREYEKVSGAKLIVLDVLREASGTKVWLYNYGWMDAKITGVEDLRGNKVSFRVVEVIGSVEENTIKPGSLAVVSIDSPNKVVIIVWGRVRIEV